MCNLFTQSGVPFLYVFAIILTRREMRLMVEDLEKFILRGMDKAQRKMGWLPNFMVKTEPPDKTRLIFKNVIEPPINFGDWTVITVSIQDLELMCEEFPRILKYDSKPL